MRGRHEQALQGELCKRRWSQAQYDEHPEGEGKRTLPRSKASLRDLGHDASSGRIEPQGTATLCYKRSLQNLSHGAQKGRPHTPECPTRMQELATTRTQTNKQAWDAERLQGVKFSTMVVLL